VGDAEHSTVPARHLLVDRQLQRQRQQLAGLQCLRRPGLIGSMRTPLKVATSVMIA